MGTAMRHLLSSLAIGVTLLGASVASAVPKLQPDRFMTDSEFRQCVELSAPAFVTMAKAAGYSDPYDLGAFYSEAVERCLEDGFKWDPWSANVAADDLYCSAVADYSATPSDPRGHGAYDLCEDTLSERLAERAP